MGLFLSITCVIGKTKSEVVESLALYANHMGGGLEKASLSLENSNCCVIEESNGNTTIFNPYDFMEWDNSSQFISTDLNAPVFSFHIHDSDFWMYILYVNGEVVDQFNPFPDYWNENISDEEIASWEGNAVTVSEIAGIGKPQEIEKYLVRWDLDAEEPPKAYPDDVYGQEDWQLLDFMRKLRLPYPLLGDETPRGETYRLWTGGLPLEPEIS